MATETNWAHDAADRLRIMLDERSEYRAGAGSKILDTLDEALTDERRATVQRIRERLVRITPRLGLDEPMGYWAQISVLSILNEEEDR